MCRAITLRYIVIVECTCTEHMKALASQTHVAHTESAFEVAGSQSLRDLNGVAGSRSLRDRGVAGSRLLRNLGVAGSRSLRDSGVAGSRPLRDLRVAGSQTPPATLRPREKNHCFYMEVI